MKNIYFIGIAVVVIVYIIHSIRKNRISVQQSILWIIYCVTLLVLSIFPKSLDWLAQALGVAYPPALFLTIAVVILFVMNFIQSKQIEELHKKVIDLGQELSVVKSEKEKK